MTNNWFWFLIMVSCIIWYSTITIYIRIQGGFDIKHMLGALQKLNDENALTGQAGGREPVVPVTPEIGVKK